MKNLGLKIYVNDKFIKTIGISMDGTVAQILHLRNDFKNNEQSVHFHCGAYIKETNEDYKWIDQELQEHDKITIEVVKDATFDEPTDIQPHDNPAMNEFILKSKLKSFYRLRDELKDYLEE